MRARTLFLSGLILIATLSLDFLIIPKIGKAHCDTMGGPVVAAAKVALEKGDITPVLKWVRTEDESEIKELFKKTLIVRTKGPEAKELADMYFFETLVRIHRAGEGAPYTGLKNAPAEPIIQAVDKALEAGSVDQLIKRMTDSVAKGIRERYERTAERKKHSEESAGAGREFVKSYVDLTHFVERLDRDASSSALHHGDVKHEEAEEYSPH